MKVRSYTIYRLNMRFAQNRRVTESAFELYNALGVDNSPILFLLRTCDYYGRYFSNPLDIFQRSSARLPFDPSLSSSIYSEHQQPYYQHQNEDFMFIF